MKQLSTKFQYLSEAEIKDGVEFAAGQLMKLGKFSNKNAAVSYVEDVMQKLVENQYREKFLNIYNSINNYGIALKDNATSRIYNSMKLQLSILTHFNQMNWHNSPMKAAVHNARSVFANTTYNAATTINA